MSKAKAALIKRLFDNGVDKEQAARMAEDMLSTQQRLGRAAEQGFDTETKWYHGTSADITEFDPDKLGSRDFGFLGKGVYITPNEGIAKTYSRTAKGSSGAKVMPLYTSANKPYQITLEQKNMLSRGGPEQAERFKQWVINNGYDSAEVITPSGEILERVVYDPKMLRSPEAKFENPKSGKLLAGATGAAVLAGGQSEDAEAGILGIKGFSDEVGRLLETGLLKQQSKASPQAIKAAANKYNKLLKESPGFARREDLAAMNDSVTKRTIESFKEGAKVYTPEDLLNMNAVIMPVKGDQSFIGSIEQVSGIPLTETITAQGGFQYPFSNAEGWQSMEKVAANFLDKARRVSDANQGAPVAALYSQMGREAVNFSSTPSEIIVDQVQGYLSPDSKAVKQFDAEMRDKYKDWVGIMSPNAKAWLNGDEGFKREGKRRTYFSSLTKKKDYRDAGFPVYETIVDQLNHPLLQNQPIGTSGASLFFPDLNRDVFVDPTVHRSYDTVIPQDKSRQPGRLEVPTAFSDVYNQTYPKVAQEYTKPTVSKKTGEVTPARPLTEQEAQNAIAIRKSGTAPETLGYQPTNEQWAERLTKAIELEKLKRATATTGGLGMLGGATLLSPRDAQAAGLSASIEAPRNETAAYLYDLVNRANSKVGDKGLGMLLQRTGIEDYLRKAAYGDDISYLDRLFASLDLAP